VQVIRSQQNSTEAQEGSKGAANGVSSVNPAAGGSLASQSAEKSQRQNQTINYEINRTVKRIVKPLAEVKRLSVAAVLDGKYTPGTDKDGNQTKTYVARTQAELDQFANIVKQAMGYSADREDQVTVESLPFAFMEEMSLEMNPGVDWLAMIKRFGHLAGYAVLLLISFVFIVRPMTRVVSDVSVAVEQQTLRYGAGAQQQALPSPDGRQALPEPKAISPRERAVHLTKQDPDMAVEHVRSWLSEAS